MIDIDHMAFAHKDKRAKKDVASMSSIRAAALALLEGCMFARKAGGIRMGLGKPSHPPPKQSGRREGDIIISPFM